MSELRRHLEDYLRLRRALGFKLRVPGHVLPSLVTYLEAGRRRHDHRRAGARLGRAAPRRAARSPGRTGWAPPAGSPATCRPSTRPPRSRPPGSGPRHAPARALHLVRGRHPPPARRRPGSCARRCGRRPIETLFGCSPPPACASARRIGLDRADVDLDGGVLTIRDGKFGRSRLVPLHPTRHRARCARYAAPPRPAAARSPAATAFFVSTAGTRAAAPAAWTAPSPSSPTAWDCAPPASRPRIHDLRHTFAVRHAARLAPRRRRRRTPGCRCCRPTSGTSARPAPTGT